jgi:hypothetical protein
MSKSQKYFLLFVGYALILLLVSIIEYLFGYHIRPFYILPVYTVLLLSMSKGKIVKSKGV